MRKIIFLILFFYSSFSYSYRGIYSFTVSERDLVSVSVSPFENSLINVIKPCSFFNLLRSADGYLSDFRFLTTWDSAYTYQCVAVGFYEQGFAVGLWSDINSKEDLPFDSYHGWLPVSPHEYRQPFYLPSGYYVGMFATDNITRLNNYYSYNVRHLWHELATYVDPWQLYIYACATGCDYTINNFNDFLIVRVIKPSNLNKSQKTAITSNELQSEENSKLGSIANSKSTDISLLEDIKHLFSSMKSKFSSHVEKQKCDTFGVCDDSNHPPELDDSAPELKNDTVDLANIQPLMSGSGSCPADMSISVLGQNQTISFQTFCELAERARPVVIAAAQVAAAWLVFGAL